MSDVSIVIVLVGALSGLLAWLLVQGNKSGRTPDAGTLGDGDRSLPRARHYQYFPQIRQALSAADARYLKEHASPDTARKALRERRQVAQRFLLGLHEDFSSLARLGRVIAALSPEISRQQETERLILTMKFQVLYSLVRLRLYTGSVPLDQIAGLTGLVGRLAIRMDEAMAQVSAHSMGPLGQDSRA
jgi:hypothetical protein